VGERTVPGSLDLKMAKKLPSFSKKKVASSSVFFSLTNPPHCAVVLGEEEESNVLQASAKLYIFDREKREKVTTRQ
jgi:hypothetical protein